MINNVDKFISKVSHQESDVIAVDFDGVIHTNSKGFYDGTIYDKPMEGTYESLKALSQKYKIVVFTCKALKDRPLINNKTGIELIWEWIDNNNLRSFVSGVTDTKPRALFYIDDKGIRFQNWEDTMRFINERG